MNIFGKTTILTLALWAIIGVPAAGQAINPLPAQALGALSVPRTPTELAGPTSLTPNLLEGREFLSPQAVAVDTSATEPILYVADTGNHRVLGFKNPGSSWALQRADFVIGQRDLSSSWANTPGQAAPNYGSGLNSPAGVAVDRQGNLFVLDFGNNRILRYPKPSEQQGVITADLVIGQADLNSRLPNRSTAANAAPRADTLRFGTSVVGVQFASIAFDREGNLWVTDNGNHRVLRYPASEVSGSSNTATPRTINADYVLGQTDFVTATANPARATTAALAAQDIQNKLKLRHGSALALDGAGNLYVADDLGRVLFWRSGFSPDNLGRPADRILGLFVPQSAAEVVPFNDFSLTTQTSGSIFAFGPKGLAVVGDSLFVSDTLANRVVRYPRPAEWPAETTTAPSPRMAAVVGQPDFLSGRANRGAMEPWADSFSFPTGLAHDPRTHDLYVVDTRNHRVLVHTYDEGSLSVAPARAVVGQTGFEFRAPNYIEGREFGPGAVAFLSSTGAITTVPVGPHAAIDYSSSPARLYIADPLNNRVLGFADARRVTAGSKADIVIGQVDFYRNLVNSPTNNPETPGDTGLSTPSAVAVDAEGHLYVADTGNGRVLRFPRPFDQEGQKRADMVIGQRDFSSRDSAVNERTLHRPVSLALTGNDSLAVADLATHRVLIFARGDFASGMHASRVIGQLDYVSSEPGTLENRLGYPLQISVDADDNLYIADYGNNRIQIFYRVSAVGEGNGVDASATIQVQNSRLVGVVASKRRSQFWIVDAGTASNNPGRVFRIPDRDLFFFTGSLSSDAIIQTASPRAAVLDERDNPLILDGTGRMTLHYPQLTAANWANGFNRVSPGMIATLRIPGVQLGGTGTEVTGPTVPLELDDLEVTVGGHKSPIIQVNQDDARIIISKNAPGTGFAEFLVRRPSTGEILAHSFINMTTVSPGILMQTPAAPSAPALAFNEDGQRNSESNRAKVGSTVTVFLTGYGYFDGLPDDGTASDAEVPSAGSLRVIIFNANNVAISLNTEVVSSTLDPERPGVWKLKIKVPQIQTSGEYWIGVAYKNVNSYLTPVNPMPAGQVRPVISLAL